MILKSVFLLLILTASSQASIVNSSGIEEFTGEVIFRSLLTYKQQATPVNPASGYNTCYVKSDDKFYCKSFAGVESLIGPSEAPSQILAFVSEAGIGGAATETYTVTGLLASDTILAVTPKVATTTSTWIMSIGAHANDSLPVTYAADPAVGGRVLVTVKR